MLAELVAIFMSTAAAAALQNSAQVVSLGYTPSNAFTTANFFSVVVELILEVMCEIVADTGASFAEIVHGLPVTSYFRLVDSPYVAVAHLAQTWAGVSIAIYAFLRHPSVFLCPTSSFECDCLSDPQIGPWYATACSELLSPDNLSSGVNGTIAQDARSNSAPFNPSIDSFFIGNNFLLAVLTGVSVLAATVLVLLSVMYARKQKRKIQVRHLTVELVSTTIKAEQLAIDLSNAKKEMAARVAEALGCREVEVKTRELGGFLSFVAHDYQNLFFCADSAVDYLQHSPTLDPEAKRHVDTLADMHDRIAGMFNDVIEFQASAGSSALVSLSLLFAVF